MRSFEDKVYDWERVTARDIAKGIAVVVSVVGSIILGTTQGYKAARPKHSTFYNPIGLEAQVNKEYVKPSQLEAPQWKDIDGDGKYEATIKVDGKDYLFRFTGQGKPTLALYTVTPQKVEQAKIVVEDSK